MVSKSEIQIMIEGPKRLFGLAQDIDAGILTQEEANKILIKIGSGEQTEEEFLFQLGMQFNIHGEVLPKEDE